MIESDIQKNINHEPKKRIRHFPVGVWGQEEEWSESENRWHPASTEGTEETTQTESESVQGVEDPLDKKEISANL